MLIVGRECILSARGAEYLGTANKGKDGRVCEQWKNTALPPYQWALMEETNKMISTDKASSDNLCRNIDYDSEGPWCLSKQGQRLYCDVPYCCKMILA